MGRMNGSSIERALEAWQDCINWLREMTEIMRIERIEMRKRKDDCATGAKHMFSLCESDLDQ